MVRKVSVFTATELMEHWRYSTVYVGSHKRWWDLHPFRRVVNRFKMQPEGFNDYQ